MHPLNWGRGKEKGRKMLQVLICASNSDKWTQIKNKIFK